LKWQVGTRKLFHSFLFVGVYRRITSKSSKQERILENVDIFDFAVSEEDMKILDNMPTEQ